MRYAKMETADLNGDGRVDVLGMVQVAATNGIAVQLGKAGGGFSVPTVYAVNRSPIDFKLADATGDGIRDLIVIDEYPAALSVFAGQSNGTFAAKVDYLLPANGNAISVGDVTGDARNDIVVATNAGASNGSVSVLPGLANGTFGAAVDYAVSAYPTSVTIGDFDGDGRNDVLATGFFPVTTTLTTLRGQAGGTLGGRVDDVLNGVGVGSVIPFDSNGDGRTDLLAAGNTGAKIFAGQANGSFVQSSVNGLTGANSLRLADISGDGRADIVATFDGPKRFQVALGLAGGGFGTPGATYVLPTSTHSVALGDADQDGDVDLIVNALAGFSGMDSSLAIVQGTGGGAFHTGARSLLPSAFSGRGATTADFNEDGRPDVAITSYVLNSNDLFVARVFLTNANGTFGTPVDVPAGGLGAAIVNGDFNGDGHADLAIATGDSNFANPTPNTLSILLGHGNGSFDPAVSFPLAGESWRSMIAGDINGDGRDDLFVNGSIVQSFLSQSSGSLFRAPVHIFSNIGHMAFADINGDDKLDFVSSHSWSNTPISVALGKGDGTFALSKSYGTGVRAGTLAIADLNGDGRDDVVTVGLNNTGTGSPAYATVLLGQANGSVQTASTSPIARVDFNAIDLADLNRDGYLDIVSADSTQGGIAVMLGGANLVFTTERSYAMDVTPMAIALADFDGDRLIDVASPSDYSGGYNLTVLTNLLPSGETVAPAVQTVQVDMTADVPVAVVTFSEVVPAFALDKHDLIITNTTTGQRFVATGMTRSANLLSATFTLPVGSLISGNYTFNFASGSFADVVGNVASSAFAESSNNDFWLSGDLDRDRDVDFDDLIVLAANYGQKRIDRTRRGTSIDPRIERSTSTTC